MKDVKQCKAFSNKESLQKSISTIKRSLITLVPSTLRISLNTLSTFLCIIIKRWTLHTNDKGELSAPSSVPTSWITPRLCAVLSVMTKWIRSYISTSRYFLPVAKETISRVIFSSSVRLCTDSVKTGNVGRGLLFDEPSFEYLVSHWGLMISVTIPAKIIVSKYGSVLFILVGAGSVIIYFPSFLIYFPFSEYLPAK